MIKCFPSPEWHIRGKAIFKSLVCLVFVLLSTEAKPQTHDPFPTPPLDIPAGVATGGARSTFNGLPSSTSAKLTVDIAEPDPIALSHLKLMAYPGFPSQNGLPPPDVAQSTLVLLWDGEQLQNSSHQLVKDVHLVANLPFAGLPGFPPGTFSYTVQAIDNTYGQQNGPPVGQLVNASLTPDPSNPGHIAGSPIVKLLGGTNNEPLPTSITFGSNLNVVATAIGNPSSYKITRLGIRITETLNKAKPYLNHNSGLAADVYAPAQVMQPASSNSVLTLPYTPPILPPGNYRIEATAWDNAGFKSNVSKNLTVKRSFGFFSVLNAPLAPVTGFSAALDLENQTAIAAENLRVRLITVPGSAFLEQGGPPPLPPIAPLSGAAIVQYLAWRQEKSNMFQ